MANSGLGDEGGKLKGRPLPPHLFLLCLAAATLLHFVVGPRPLVDAISTLQRLVGIALVTVVVWTKKHMFAAFESHGGTPEFRDHTKKVMTDGWFAYARNPYYLWDSGFFVGLSLAFNNQYILWMTIPFFVALDRIVVPGEEANLTQLFGDEYKAYCRKVKRWGLF